MFGFGGGRARNCGVLRSGAFGLKSSEVEGIQEL